MIKGASNVAWLCPKATKSTGPQIEQPLIFNGV